VLGWTSVGSRTRRREPCLVIFVLGTGLWEPGPRGQLTLPRRVARFLTHIHGFRALSPVSKHCRSAFSRKDEEVDSCWHHVSPCPPREWPGCYWLFCASCVFCLLCGRAGRWGGDLASLAQCGWKFCLRRPKPRQSGYPLAPAVRSTPVCPVPTSRSCQDRRSRQPQACQKGPSTLSAVRLLVAMSGDSTRLLAPKLSPFRGGDQVQGVGTGDCCI
jgi:hypothetical protein